MIAADHGRVAEVRGLLKRGADPDLVDPAGKSALWMACDQQHAKIVTLLLDAGARVTAKTVRVARSNARNTTPLPPVLLARLAAAAKTKDLADRITVRRVRRITEPELAKLGTPLAPSLRRFLLERGEVQVRKNGSVAVAFFSPAKMLAERKRLARWTDAEDTLLPLAGVPDDWYFIVDRRIGRIYRWWHEEAARFAEVCGDAGALLRALERHPDLDPWVVDPLRKGARSSRA